MDFVPGVEPHEFITLAELIAENERTRVVMTMEALHDETWTERLVMGRQNELDNLAQALAAR